MKNTEFADLFYTGTTQIALGRPIDEYLKSTQVNWEAVLSKSFNPYGDNTETITIAVAKKKAKDPDYDL